MQLEGKPGIFNPSIEDLAFVEECPGYIKLRSRVDSKFFYMVTKRASASQIFDEGMKAAGESTVVAQQKNSPVDSINSEEYRAQRLKTTGSN